MKKFGFTLAEILIALGVAGILAAVTMNVMNSIMPDKDKVKVLKTYKIVLDVNEEILNDKELFNSSSPDGSIFERINIPEHIKKDNNIPDNNDSSYAEMFAANLHLKDNVESHNSPITFTTIDGTQWFLKEIDSDDLTITVDFHADKTARCSYNSTSCTNPGQFVFRIDKKGHVYPNDSLTAAYLANPDKFNTKQDDYKTAKEDKTKYKT